MTYFSDPSRPPIRVYRIDPEEESCIGCGRARNPDEEIDPFWIIAAPKAVVPKTVSDIELDFNIFGPICDGCLDGVHAETRKEEPISLAKVWTDDGWDGYYVNGELKHEGHGVPDEWLYAWLDVPYLSIHANEEWIEREGGLPKRLEDVVAES
jgi:hypothetical protein